MNSTPNRARPGRAQRLVITPVYDAYWNFAVERQAVFFRRHSAQPQPWTSDPIIGTYKFTNAYRASDRVSQYFIRHVAYEGSQNRKEVFFRSILFKLFNKIETWELLRERVGEIVYPGFSHKRYDKILNDAISAGDKIYSGAYIMPSGKGTFGEARKHGNHLHLIAYMMKNELPNRIADSQSMGDAYELLLGCPTIGPFLAYQLVTDLNYTTLTDFDEMEFVMPGPGARDGIRKCFKELGGFNETDIIRYVADRQEEEFEKRSLDFQDLWGRRLQLIDCQNLFCEVSKYSRVSHPDVQGISGRTRIKQKFKPTNQGIEYWYPPKWGLNQRIKREAGQDVRRRSA